MARTTGSSELHQLILSLTAAEKAYFKKYARRHSEKSPDYLNLFDAIDKMESYQETALKKKFKSLPVLKNYLFELILESLFVSETDTSTVNFVLKGIVKINLLIKRGLRTKALKLLAEYKTTSERAGYYHLLAYLLKIEFNITRMSWLPKEQLSKTKAAMQAIRKAEQMQMNADDFLNQDVIGLSIALLERNTGKLLPVEEWMDVNFLSDPKNAMSPLAEGNRLSALAGYYDLKGDAENSYIVNREEYLFTKKRWKEGKGSIRPDFYINALNTYLAGTLLKKNITLAAALVGELASIPVTGHNSIIENDLRYMFYRQNILWANGEHNDGVTFSEEALKKQHQVFNMPHYTSKLIKIIGKKAVFEFSVQDYRQAMNTLLFFNSSQLNNYSEVDKKTAEFLNLLIQYEMGNFDLIKGIVRSIKNRIKSLTKIDRDFLTAFSKYNSNTDLLLGALQKKCGTLYLLDTLHLNDWIESKINRRPLSAIVRKNWNLS